ncbi:endoplasmic reticulum-Golgi intermediate compartment protein 1-like [Homarus americanus]|uniref:endoplasmic reticulum-Golgi intermediate compartment protein 1-like n=1 Tax=Homarus americanus TaxID=6706 RepID=UPI001C472CC7|nr:endoplasmic reticulum-Golgi intermediate compartment protein 1-like [Homarus americanus]
MVLFNFDVRRLDIYRKVPKDLTQPTLTGAVISVTCITFMLILFTSELLHFLSGEIVSELYVDNPGESTDRIPVYIKISLPRLKCDYIGLDIQDDLGRHEVGFVENTNKNPIGEEGCLFEANFLINKVPGNFHVSTHSADKQPEDIDFGHVIHEVRFGSKIDNPNVPGTFNPLYGRAKIDGNALESHDYVMKVVPTIYEEPSGNQLIAYQYTYAYRSYVSFSHGGRVVPAVWFRYDLTPITVKYHAKRPPFYSFVTTVCAIIGGTFTVAGIIDSFIFTASEIFKKFELGKQS